MNPAFIRLLELGAVEAFRHIRGRRASAAPATGATAPAPEFTEANYREVIEEMARGLELSERLTERLDTLNGELGRQRTVLQRLMWAVVGQSVVLLGLVVFLVVRGGLSP